MHTLKTHKGDTLLLIEVPLDAKDFKFNKDDFSQIIMFITNNCIDSLDIDFNKNYEIIGTTSTLTDGLVAPFVYKPQSNYNSEGGWTEFYDYVHQSWNMINLHPNNEDGGWLESWNSFLQHNEIDLTKNYCVLKEKK
jgi:hypothetical protein